MAAALVVAATAVPRRDVKIAGIVRPRTEADPTAVMVAVKLVETEQHALDQARLSFFPDDGELRDVGNTGVESAAGGDVIQIERAVRGVVRIKGKAEQSALALGVD